jgi:hypothetical protein
MNFVLAPSMSVRERSALLICVSCSQRRSCRARTVGAGTCFARQKISSCCGSISVMRVTTLFEVAAGPPRHAVLIGSFKRRGARRSKPFSGLLASKSLDLDI